MHSWGGCQENGHHVPRVLQRLAVASDEGRGLSAGLNVIRIINEQTAAAIAYGLDKGSPGERKSLSSTLAIGRSVLFVAVD